MQFQIYAQMNQLMSEGNALQICINSGDVLSTNVGVLTGED